MSNSILRNKNFMLLWLGQTVSKLGNRFYGLALMWYIIEKTESPLALGISVICFTLPAVFIEPLAGVLADRYDKKKIICLTDLFNGMVMLLFSYVIYQDHFPLHVLYGLAVISSSISALFSPAISAAIPLLVDQENFTRANSLNQFSSQMTNILGPALAGVLIALTNIWILFFINGISFILSAISEAFIDIPKIEIQGEKENFFLNLKEGFAYVLTNRELLYLVVAGGIVINFFLAPLNVYATILCRDVLGKDATALGMLNSAIAVGALVGALILLTKAFGDMVKMTVLGLSLEGLAVLLLAVFANSFPLLLIIAAFMGFNISLASIGIGTLYQRIIPKSMMGRAMGIVSMLCSITVPLGTLLGSMSILYVDIRVILLISGIFVSLTGLSLIAALKSLRSSSSDIKVQPT